MATIAFPADTLLCRGPASITWGLQGQTLKHQSPLSGAIRTVRTPGSRWRFTAQWPLLSPQYRPVYPYASDRAQIEAFLAALDGQANRFTFYPPESVGPDHGMRGSTNHIVSATVNGAGQTGTTLACMATYYSETLAGSFFSVNGELKRIVSSDSTAPGGAIFLHFSPALRASPPHGAFVSFVKPVSTFMLLDDYAPVTVGAGGFAEFTLDAIEAWS